MVKSAVFVLNGSGRPGRTSYTSENFPAREFEKIWTRTHAR